MKNLPDLHDLPKELKTKHNKIIFQSFCKNILCEICVCEYLHEENDNILILSKPGLSKIFLELAVEGVAFNYVIEIV